MTLPPSAALRERPVLDNLKEHLEAIVRINEPRSLCITVPRARALLAALSDAGPAVVPDVKWFGHAGHFICAPWCRFHLTTQVGPWLVSTVGEYWPDRPVREIHARTHDPKWLAQNGLLKGDAFDAAYMERFGYETIGCDRLYETMVFRAGAPCPAPKCGCGLPTIDGSEEDFSGYNDPASATKGHHAMVEKYRIERVR